FVSVPGETHELRELFRARVVNITPLEEVATPSLPGSRSISHLQQGAGSHDCYRRAELTVAFPFDNIGCNLPTLLATVTGNLFELREFSGLRLLDLTFPNEFRSFAGPQFGIEGTQHLAGVFKRPMIGTIIKPSVGLPPEATAEIVRTLGNAGIDFIKDDELMADPPHSPLSVRVPRVMREINRIADATGKKVMYAFNISDEPEAMLRHHDLVVQYGGTCVMVSIHHVGLSGVMALRNHASVPIHGHRNGWGLYARSPSIGIDYTAWQKIWRLAGVDHLHVNGLQNKFSESDDSVVKSINACLTPLFNDSDRAMPVISSGQWGGQAPETYQRTQTTDLMYLAGGGIMAHPAGPAAGCLALRQAWEAATAGIPLETYAAKHTELRQTIEKFGGGAKR
ncbi:MAG: ribulose-bisphosphate carboxylase large subunit family protein, partial [Planctomycetales bacterium]|nr:ribulose-bisphosphate carboxylase large subunit family protein [Planctomycetales bacterium]